MHQFGSEPSGFVLFPKSGIVALEVHMVSFEALLQGLEGQPTPRTEAQFEVDCELFEAELKAAIHLAGGVERYFGTGNTTEVIAGAMIRCMALGYRLGDFVASQPHNRSNQP